MPVDKSCTKSCGRGETVTCTLDKGGEGCTCTCSKG